MSAGQKAEGQHGVEVTDTRFGGLCLGIGSACELTQTIASGQCEALKDGKLL